MKKPVIAIAILALVAVFWLALKPAKLPTEPPPAQAETPPSAQPSATVDATSPIATTTPKKPAAPKPPTEPPPENWSDLLDQILRAEKPESEKATQLLATFPSLQEADQIEAARHIVNLLGDDQFDHLKAHLLDTTLPEEVVSIFFHDLMLRPEPVKAPLFLAVMQTPDHPFAETAKTALEAFVGADHTTDWPQWETALRAKLKELEAQ